MGAATLQARTLQGKQLKDTPDQASWNGKGTKKSSFRQHRVMARRPGVDCPQS
jgi:hypothetical protein